MSETVKRYHMEWIVNDSAPTSDMCTASDGDWVRHADYAAEVARRERAEAENVRLREALTTMNALHNLGDAIYDVRERECQGWDGPNVTAYNEAYKVVQAFLALAPATPHAGGDDGQA